ncbi:hypothetical protein HHL24_28995 [Paraburkholderia sp. RP-4-7]|uniref:Uncharacterized protein n=1 Tax=Paraburkholderia polaris TaxID=2728848 RepID=A0A848IM25_9BURK|nr:hypothetical protein [Paraburkholderia polaris]NMM01956.1 hypothetical protein [Paraburkholderia polaris]
MFAVDKQILTDTANVNWHIRETIATQANACSCPSQSGARPYESDCEKPFEIKGSTNTGAGRHACQQMKNPLRANTRHYATSQLGHAYVRAKAMSLKGMFFKDVIQCSALTMDCVAGINPPTQPKNEASQLSSRKFS